MAHDNGNQMISIVCYDRKRAMLRRVEETELYNTKHENWKTSFTSRQVFFQFLIG